MLNLWGVAPAIAAVLIGGGTGHPTPTLAPTTTEVLQQVSAEGWQATVALADAGLTCPSHAASFWLVITSPDRVVPAHSVSPATGARSGRARCAQVTVHFDGLGQTPEIATLEFLPASSGLPSSVQLAVSRRVTLWEYLAIPLAAGIAMAVALFFSVLKFVRLYDRHKKLIKPRWGRDYRHYIVFASGAWTVNDSWATNIATIIAFLGTVLTTTTAANTLFPGVALDRFSILTTLAGAIVVSAPLVFAPLYARWTAKNPGVTADAVITAPGLLCPAGKARLDAPHHMSGLSTSKKAQPDPIAALLAAAAIAADLANHRGDLAPEVSAPAGAALTLSDSPAIIGAGRPEPMQVKPGTVLQIPVNSDILLVCPGEVALPGGSDIMASGTVVLRISRRDADGPSNDGSKGLTVPGTQIATASDPGTHRHRHHDAASSPDEVTLEFPVLLATTAAKITIVGAGEITLPAGTKIDTPRRREQEPLNQLRVLPVPQATGSTLVANMRLVVIAALITMLGVGAEIGIAGVLGFGLSDWNSAGRWLSLAVLAVIAAWTIYYSTTAIRALADPEPGSSLSSGSGTSFTL